jgi:GntR family transcriptional repressor for pyruvate dehydrogenase complex
MGGAGALSERVRILEKDDQNPFRAVRKTCASREIVAQIRDLIAGGRLKAGDRLPPERELAKILGVSRSTLREAVRVMEFLGLVDVRPGGGTFLAEPDASQRADYLPGDLFSRCTTRLNLFELRAVLEPGLAGLAARRVTPDYVMKMRAVLEAQAANVERGESGMEEDAVFHTLIAEATGNPALIQLMETLTRLLQETRDASLQRNGRPARSLGQNKAIFEAIEAGSSTLATRRMQAHIRSLERTLFAIGLHPVEVLQAVNEGGNGAHSQIVAAKFSANCDGIWAL